MIDKRAVIDESAIIEDNVSIGPFTVIGKDVVIKSGTVIGANSSIEYAEIGNNCKISNSVSVGSPPQDLSYKDELSKVFIGGGTILREFVTINRGSAKTLKTVIGENCFFMACSHAAHDTRVGDNVIFANNAAIGGHVEVGDNTFLGGQSGVHQFCKIGRGVMVGAGSIVTMDIIPYALCCGDRAVLDGLNLVGMRRKKMGQKEIDDIKKAYRILFLSKLLLKDAVSEIEKIDCIYVKEITDFIKNSKRAIARPK
ncbi:MAG: acyl-ACP--UDP-N-acetylglucosamine O-acyltransferase [Elusimicrobiota bacterium]|jgi:UDP-N-acetylglucosamine acyltransferase|nr:acyl-ACP--UDP-N-acetylglucosamine O-acyltransferase [Elusimicrobiota bacterium]